jgi:hypothetical protein
LSIVHERAIAPWRLTRPYVGRRPVTPQYDEGFVIEPSVSDPIANGTNPALTLEPDPLDDPPLQQPKFHGVLHGPVNDAFA